MLTQFTSQQEVFESSVRPLVDQVLMGFSATAFAYGQTGTGKTYTMQGMLDNEESLGIIPRCAHQIFGALGEPGRFESSRVTVSYLEIYNEECFDLLLPIGTRDEDRPKLRIVEDKTVEGRGVYCMGLIERDVVAADEILEIVVAADEKRRVEETQMVSF